MKESKLQLSIKKALLQAYGGYWKKTHGNQYQMGLPDLIGCVSGLWLSIEVKLPNKSSSKLSELQKNEMKKIRAAGGCAITARSVEQAIRRIGIYLYEKGAIKKEAIPIPTQSSDLCIKKKKSRVIHGAGNWEDYCDTSNDLGALQIRRSSKRLSNLS